MNRGEIWLNNLDPTVGAEVQKTRPAVIVSVDDVGVLPLRVIVPITEWKERYAQAPWMVRINPTPENGLQKVSCADTFQVRSVSTGRFVRMLGHIDTAEMRAIEEALAITLGLPFFPREVEGLE